MMNETIQSLNVWMPASSGVCCDILRLDLIHPVVSGNKVFKLGPYLERAIQQNAPGLVGFGGAWSNHLHAMAFAAREKGLRTMAFIRGEEPAESNGMLDDCLNWGMDLHFVERKIYRDLSRMVGQWAQEYLERKDQIAKADSKSQAAFAIADESKRILPSVLIKALNNGWIVIPEGGFGLPGVEGAARIWQLVPQGQYTHIICAVGTGTMVAGLALARHRAGQNQAAGVSLPKIIGLPVLKHPELEGDISMLLPSSTGDELPHLLHRFHGGGYAKTSPELISFMNNFFHATGVPTDLVYTSKLLYGIGQLVKEGYFPEGSKLIAIHSGGLQGNRSLKKGILAF